jgi:hypothetical protein
MNERIKLLAEQALKSSMVHDGMYRPEGYANGVSKDFADKFAELIVRECISIVDEQKECLHEEQKYWHDRDYGYEMAVDDASKGIKQFFGVEE